MGDRANIILTDGETRSPAIYLHWHRPQVGNYIKRLAEVMEGRPNDLAYATARLIGIIHNDIDGNLSLGVSDSAVDGEDFLIDLRTYKTTDGKTLSLAKRDGGQADRIACAAIAAAREANHGAGVMAAAPELLSALEAVSTHFSAGRDLPLECWNTVFSAIAKAKGV